ncbi:hypothetical protein QJS04_geneDACA010423 [Acorus gramineus]|uniref:Uncharacterized protein n=1 Tax=Acorus gramineus TaxID=55184 RepID=A0AAV9A2E1_ACOGR|nr:hypothetical protein QJS04_geneDACA010423 [Acorus gramineus]
MKKCGEKSKGEIYKLSLDSTFFLKNPPKEGEVKKAKEAEKEKCGENPRERNTNSPSIPPSS